MFASVWTGSNDSWDSDKKKEWKKFIQAPFRNGSSICNKYSRKVLPVWYHTYLQIPIYKNPFMHDITCFFALHVCISECFVMVNNIHLFIGKSTQGGDWE